MQKIYSHIGSYLRWYVLLILIILAGVLFSIILHENRQGMLTFAVLDVGQGDALFIESPTGVQVLVDGGPGKALSQQISKVMPWYDRHIDMIVVTNPDKDHYEGFISLLNKYKVDVVLEPGTTNPDPAYAVFENKIQEKNISKTLARSGQVIDLGGGAYLEVLFPDRDISGLSPNDGSIVMRLVYGQTSVMLQGDSTARIEEYLQTKNLNLESTILKIGHHGSKTSSIESYVTTVSPKFAVISSGKNNSYGHPHKEVLDTLDKFNIEAYSTCNNGMMVWKSDGEKFILKNKNIMEAVVGCKI